RALGLIVLEPTFDLLVDLPLAYLCRHVSKMSLDEARKLTTPVFVKPADGNKAFDSQIYRSGAELPSRYISMKLPVLVSEPVKWEAEYRFFVFEREILTFSIYAREGELACTDDGRWIAPDAEAEEAVHFCESLLRDTQVILPPVLVIDLGRIHGRGWAV